MLLSINYWKYPLEIAMIKYILKERGEAMITSIVVFFFLIWLFCCAFKDE
jgi:hypothetical protein